MKSLLTSKTFWVNAIVIVASGLSLCLGLFPAEWGGYVVGAVGLANLALRFITKGTVTVALPSSVPAIPPILQAGLEAVEKLLGTLPPEFGPSAFELVAEAAQGDFPDNDARFNYVLAALQTKFPGVGVNATRAVIEDLVLALNQGLQPTLSASASGVK